MHAGALVTVGIDIGDVVADDLKVFLELLETTDTCLE